MKTIKSQLEQIHKLGNSVPEITKNYECGFITVMEMMGQINEVHTQMGKIILEICEEHKINQNAVYLMLNL